ncbi:MAG TPA: cell division protein FtsQ/DivIB [Rhizomicrobium sp.]|nr:cell division protein FtsQ/DivIB [Rhizomicrobium sp.]
MRPVSATRKQRRESSRVGVDRRTSARAAAERPAFGQRKKSRNSPVSRLVGNVRNALSLRRPVVLATFSLLVLAVIASAWAAGYSNRALAGADRAMRALVADAGFGISAIHLSGNRHIPPSVILNALGFAPGQSIFDADVRSARERLLKLDWAADAKVARRYPDSIYVRVVEKVPFAVWSSGRGVSVVDRAGHPIARIDAARFSKLPVFIGEQPEGASGLVGTINLYRAVSVRVRAMQRVSGRRWNLILDDGVLVKLPEQNWAKQIDALEHLIIDTGILERDIAEIDLRSPDNYFFVLRNAVRQKVARGSRA